MPVEQLVQSLCDTKQGYTQFGIRHFSVFFVAGWDKIFGFQLCMSDPHGKYEGWKVVAIGAYNQAAHSMLKQEYKDDMIESPDKDKDEDTETRPKRSCRDELRGHKTSAQGTVEEIDFNKKFKINPK
eukprot:Gb_25656 [translate_table: standard]